MSLQAISMIFVGGLIVVYVLAALVSVHIARRGRDTYLRTGQWPWSLTALEKIEERGALYKVQGRLALAGTAGFGMMAMVAAALLGGGTPTTIKIIFVMMMVGAVLGLIVSLIGQVMMQFGTRLREKVERG